MLLTEKTLTTLVDYIEHTKRWASEFVVNYNLCPFAKGPLENDEISWTVAQSVEVIDELIDGFILSQFTSTFIIFPFLTSFADFLEVADFTEHLVEVLGYEDDIKLVLFHPQNQYAETEVNDEVNFANKSPYATIQMLRNSDLEKLNMTEERKNEILDRNAKNLKEIGSEKLREIFDGFTK
jgi:hypothetical protein